MGVGVDDGVGLFELFDDDFGTDLTIVVQTHSNRNSCQRGIHTFFEFHI